MHPRTLCLTACAALVASAALSGCVMDGPFVSADIDKLVSKDSAVAWSRHGAEPPVTPLAVPVSLAAAPVDRADTHRAQNVRDSDADRIEPPMSLPLCVDMALSKSPVTRAAWESARATAATVGIADAAYMPDIFFTGEVGPEQDLVGPIRNQQNLGLAAIGLNWVLMDFGRRDADSARARAQMIGANYSFNRAMQKLVYEVQAAYFNLDAKHSLREAARENVATARKQLDATEDRMTVGLATRPEVLQARQQFLQANYDLEDAKAAVFGAQARLSVAMGVPADRPCDIVRLSALPLPENLTTAIDRSIATALEQRPDIAAALSQVRAREEQVKRAEANFLPIISFEGFGGVSSQNYNVQIAPQNTPNDGSSTFGNYSAKLTGTWLIFDGYERAHALQQARSEVRAAHASLENLRLQTTGEVWTGYFEFFAAQKRYEAGVALLTASQDSYESVYQSYLNGLVTINDLLQAESDLFDSRFELIKSRAQLLTASATFVLALGS